MKWIDLPPVWLVWFILLGSLLPVFEPVPSWMRPVGAILVLLGVALAIWAVTEMRRAKTTPVPHQRASALVTQGPFAWSRNPIYLADLLILVGVYLWWGVWWASVPALLALAWVLTKRFIEPEEARLREDFGVAFGDWCTSVRRWL